MRKFPLNVGILVVSAFIATVAIIFWPDPWIECRYAGISQDPNVPGINVELIKRGYGHIAIASPVPDPKYLETGDGELVVHWAGSTDRQMYFFIPSYLPKRATIPLGWIQPDREFAVLYYQPRSFLIEWFESKGLSIGEVEEKAWVKGYKPLSKVEIEKLLEKHAIARD